MKVTLYVRDVGRITGDLKMQRGVKTIIFKDLLRTSSYITLKHVYIANEETGLNSVSEMVVNTKHISIIY